MLLSMGSKEQSMSPILLSTGTIDEKQVQDSLDNVVIYSYVRTFVISRQVQK